MHHHQSKISNKKLLLVIGLNFLITVVQVIGAYKAQSVSLLSDALHNFGDGLSIVLSYLAIIFSRSTASIHQTYGKKRYLILAPFVNALTLIFLSLMLIGTAIERFRSIWNSHKWS